MARSLGKKSRAAHQFGSGSIPLPMRGVVAAQVNQRSHIQATALSPEQLAEAKDAFTKLNGTSLSEAVRFYLLHDKPIGGIKPLSDVIEAVLASKKAAQLTKTHIKHLGWSLKKFAGDFSKSNVNEIQRPQIEKWFNGKSYSHQTRLNYLRDLTLLFNFAITQGWTPPIPQRRLKNRDELIRCDRAESDRGFPTLNHCPENILPGAVNKIFSGLRTSELLSLDWAQVTKRRLS